MLSIAEVRDAGYEVCSSELGLVSCAGSCGNGDCGWRLLIDARRIGDIESCADSLESFSQPGSRRRLLKHDQSDKRTV